jgi:hypothetical protein
MGIAGVEPRQLALTMGTMGSGSTDSPAPSPTNAKIDINPAIDTAVGIAVPIDADTNAQIDIDPAIDTAIGIAVPIDADTNAKIDINPAIGIAVPIDADTNAQIDIDPAIDTAIGIAVPIDADTNAKIDINPAIGIAVPIDADTNAQIDIDPAIDTAVGIAVPIYTDTNADVSIDTIINIVPSSATELIPAATIIGPTSGTTGAVSAITAGFNMAFGLFSFHVDNNGVAELIFIGDSAPPAITPGTSPVIGGNPSATAPLAPSAPLELEPRLEDSTPSVGSNGFKDPPLSPTTAYYVDCDAYHYVGAGDFSSHEIAGYEDPRGGTAAVYPTISECERVLNALTLRTAPYDPNYVEGLYSDYTCSDDDDDVYPETKGKIGTSASSCSPSESAASSDGYAADYDSNFMIEVRPYIENDDIYPPALGKISDDSTPWSGGHCMMVSHDDGNENRANDGRNRMNSGRQVVTHDQIRLARRVYAGEANFGPNPSPSDMVALRFVIQEQKDQIRADRRILERRREEADASSRRRAERSCHYSSSVQHRSRSRTQPGADMHNITQNLEAEFNEAELIPKTKEAAIMVVAAYIAANASNDDEHMRYLRNLALEGVRVLQGTLGSGHDDPQV